MLNEREWAWQPESEPCGAPFSFSSSLFPCLSASRRRSIREYHPQNVQLPSTSCRLSMVAGDTFQTVLYANRSISECVEHDVWATRYSQRTALVLWSLELPSNRIESFPQHIARPFSLRFEFDACRRELSSHWNGIAQFVFSVLHVCMK